MTFHIPFGPIFQNPINCARHRSQPLKLSSTQDTHLPKHFTSEPFPRFLYLYNFELQPEQNILIVCRDDDENIRNINIAAILLYAPKLDINESAR
mmetsp:Transcript_19398/g.31935  ORF Transcript_19398/g.31935 Transcript_19398/m.31935 type:complete len:95 (-) Transcript_19398:132-416(-)